ncbi:MAG: twin-arginine translocase subunit TatC [Anaerolineae bacterium]|nr:twin-arginine translocase subunit TatC [Anaerolineae bacterium]
MALKSKEKKPNLIEEPDSEKAVTYIEGEGPVMGFFEHIDELRKHLMRAGAALLVTTTLCMFFTGQILQYLISAAPETESMARKLQILGPTESVVVYFRVALMSGAILAMPIITWQVFAFVLPGLTREEKRFVLLSLPGIMVFFLIGVAFAWFIMTPAALTFLAEFQSEVFVVEWTADQYVAFITALLFWIGVAFETPLVFFVLGRMGFVRPRALVKNWRFAVVAAAIIAALITPTIDPFNMALVMGPLLGLYVLSIFLTAIAYRRSGVGQAEIAEKKAAREAQKRAKQAKKHTKRS